MVNDLNNSTNSICDSEAVVENNTELESYDFINIVCHVVLLKCFRGILLNYENALDRGRQIYYSQRFSNRAINLLMDRILDDFVNYLSFVSIVHSLKSFLRHL